ncbi:MAG TPA: squalene/phytoene synthase family protein, partial [Ramlibacter sp.]
MSPASDDRHRPVDHYENFPVASWLCPPPLRAPIAAIYWFARTADDIADEGDARPEERLADLAAYRDELRACLRGDPGHGRWPNVFTPLRQAIASHGLPEAPLAHLLDAFVQDVEKTRDGAGYADRAEL